MAEPDAWHRPSRLLFALEAPRAALEFAALAAAWPVVARAPRGDGHGVLLLPGFLTTDTSTLPLRQLLRRLGHTPYGWDLERNLGPTAAVVRGLPRRLQNLHEATGRPVSLVGVSLGGVFARRLARDHPGVVRQVVTLGSPFRPREEGLPPLPVPSTAIYTRGDGIVGWRSCLDREGPTSENVEVPGSHCGLGHNPIAVRVVTDRLAQPEGTWQPFDPPPQTGHQPAGAARWSR